MTLGLRVVSIALGVGVYLGWARAAVALVRRVGGDLSKLQNRVVPRVLVLGGVANLLVLGSVLLLSRILLDAGPAMLGLSNPTRNLTSALIAAFVTFASAIGFLMAARAGRITIARHQRLADLALGLAVLGVVAVQEEVLFRGFLALTLAGLGPAFILVFTTVVFVVIHFPTNPVNGPQVVSWTLGGLVLAIAYLVSGSLWVPIALHFATDAANLLVFRITRTHGWFEVDPPLSGSERAFYRAVYAVLVTGLLVAWYGTAPRWPESVARADSARPAGAE